MNPLPFTKRTTTHRSADQAFRNHCDYACAIQRGPRNTLWRRFVRFLVGPRDRLEGLR